MHEHSCRKLARPRTVQLYATMAAERCSHGIKSPRRPYLSRRGRSKALGQTELVSTVSEEQLFAPLLGLQWS